MSKLTNHTENSGRLILLSLVFSIVSCFSVYSQSVGMTGSPCVGSDIIFYLQGNCSGTTWSLSYGTITSGQGTNSIHATFNTAGNPTVTAFSTCNGSSNYYYNYPQISNTVTPTASFSLSPSSVCQGSTITFSASGTNGGASPTYNFFVDNVAQGSSTSFSTSGLSAGTHSAYVVMTSSLACVTSTSATSNPQNFTVTAKASYTVTVNGPGTICSSTPSAGMNATVTGGVGNLTYQWYKNGTAYGSPLSVNYTTVSPVSNGDQITCTVSSDYSCVNTPVSSNNAYTVSLTNSVTPTIGVQVSPLAYCSGATINFTSSGSNISGSPTYSWLLNGNQFSTSSTASAPANYVNTVGYYSNGSSVTVNVTNIGGTCLTSTSASGSAPALTINAPTVAGTLGTIPASICASGSVTLNVTGYTGSITRYMVQSQDNGGSWTSWTSTTSTPSVTTSPGVTRNYNFQAFVQNGSVCSELGTNIVSTTVSNQATYTVTVNGPGTICSSTPSAGMNATVPGGVGNLTYQWYKNGTAYGSPLSVNYTTVSPVSNGDQITCTVSSDYWCVHTPVSSSNTYTVAITNSVTPTAGVQVSPLSYCSGSTINFTATGTNISGTPTYTWKLNGNQIGSSTSPNAPPVTSSYVNTAGYYSNGSSVTVDVTNIGGTCLTSTSASGSAPALTIYAPTVAGTLGSITSSFCNNGTVSLNVTGNTGSITRYMIQSQDNGGSWTAWTTTTANPSLTTTTGIDRNYQFQVFVQNGTCAEVGTNVVGTTLYYSNVMGTLSSSVSSICANSGSTTLSLTALTTTNAQWQSRYSDNGGAYSAWSTFSTSLSTPQPFALAVANSSRVYQFQVVATNGSTCMPATSNTASSTINPIPAVTPTPSTQTIFSNQSTSIILSSPVLNTTYSYSIAPTNVTGAAVGSTTPIAQTLSSTNGTTSGSVVYTITPAASGCSGASSTATVSVYPVPIITSPSNRLVNGPVTLSTYPIYSSYSWKNGAGSVVGTGSTFSAGNPDNYTVDATVNSVTSTSTAYQVIGQYSGQSANFIVSYTAQVGGITPATSMDGLPPASATHSVEYFDGLGRPLQTVNTKGSPLLADIVVPNVYDVYGREYAKYLPFTYNNPNSGWLNANVIDGSGNYTGPALNYYNSNIAVTKIASDPQPYSQTVFEPSPLERVAKQGATGATWQPDANINSTTDRTVKYHYEYNAAGEVVLFNYSSTGGLSYTAGQFYAANQLKANRTTDEHQNDIIEYVDLNGRTVCKKVQTGVDINNQKTYASTYYIYDDLNNLVVVLPPEGVKALIQQ